MIIIPANKKLNFTTTVPSSKSYTNRALILAALAVGKSRILCPLESDDTKYMIAALKNLGVKIIKKGIKIDKSTNINNKSTNNNDKCATKNNEQKKCTTIEVTGTGGRFTKPTKEIFLGNAGTTVRFLTAALATQPFSSRLNGNERMQQRPLKDLILALRELGTDIKSKTLCPPIQIKGPLKGGTASVNGSISSQYLSALLMAAPYAENPCEIKVKSKLTSLPYVKMTLDTVKKFGGQIHIGQTKSKLKNSTDKNIAYGTSKPNSKHSQSPLEHFFCSPHHFKATRFEVEGDASSASYPWAIAAINGGTATVTNIPADSAQADLQFLDVLKKAGCKITFTKKGITVAGPKSLKALGKIDLVNMPDAAMTAAIVCAFAKGKSRLTGLGTLRVKETDRLAALETELNKTGIKTRTGKDWIEIEGGTPAGATIETYDDHRMAMCFAVMGTKVPGINIQNPGCVSKTYPGFFKDLKKWTATTT